MDENLSKKLKLLKGTRKLQALSSSSRSGQDSQASVNLGDMGEEGEEKTSSYRFQEIMKQGTLSSRLMKPVKASVRKPKVNNSSEDGGDMSMSIGSLSADSTTSSRLGGFRVQPQPQHRITQQESEAGSDSIGNDSIGNDSESSSQLGSMNFCRKIRITRSSAAGPRITCGGWIDSKSLSGGALDELEEGDEAADESRQPEPPASRGLKGSQAQIRRWLDKRADAVQNAEFKQEVRLYRCGRLVQLVPGDRGFLGNTHLKIHELYGKPVWNEVFGTPPSASSSFARLPTA